MKAAFLFPGQGSQFVGMGQEHLRRHPAVARLFEQASDQLGLDLLGVMSRGPRQTLRQTDVAQVAIFTLSVALTRLLASLGLAPAVVAGHSLGQFSALVACGALSFESGLALVIERGRLMHEANQRSDGAMLAVAALDPDQVANIASAFDHVWLANFNAPDQVILSGLRSQLKQAQSDVMAAGGKAVWLEVAGAYHSPLLREASDQFNRMIERTPLNDAQVPLICNSHAEARQAACDLRAELHRHMLMPVRWAQTLSRLRGMPVDRWMEVGCGKVLRGLALRNAPGMPCLGTDTARELEQALQVLGGRMPCASS